MKTQITILLLMSTILSTAQTLDRKQVRAFEHQLEDVMEIIDTTYLKKKLITVEQVYTENPTLLNKARMGLIAHEIALNFSFLTKTEYTGYAQKSYDLLDELVKNGTTPAGLLPFVASYRASALAILAGETRKLKLLSTAFQDFEKAVQQYSEVSYAPEFMRGSVAENLSWLFWKKRKYAALDFQSIIDKNSKDQTYANPKIMSFTYWGWARQHQQKKYRTQALEYLNRAIAIDPEYKAGRQRAEELKAKLNL